MSNLSDTNNNDPVKKLVERKNGQEELSPMDLNPTDHPKENEDMVAFEELHPFLQKLSDEHKDFIQQLDVFESTLNEIKEGGISKEIDKKLSTFFEFYDHHVLEHNKKEESALFSLLKIRLSKKGEHNKGNNAYAGVDKMEEEHTHALQLAAVVFNFLGLFPRLQDNNSKLVVLDLALQKGFELIELYRLHIYREDNIIFPQAHDVITTEEFDEMLADFTA